MAKIPRGEDVTLITPSGQSALTTLDTRGVGTGLQAAGGVLADIGTQLAERRNNYQMAQAEAEFLTAKVQLDNAFNEDPDYATIPDRYGTGITSAAGKAAELISNPRLREQFLTRIQPRIAEGGERIKNIAWNTEKDYQRGYIDEKLAGAREAVINGDVGDAVDTTEAMISSAVEMGYLSAEEASTTLRKWQDDAVVAKLETLSPQERLDSLAEPWAGSIPSDARVRLERDAKDKLVQGKAQSNTDSYLASGLDQGTALAKARTISDPVEREATTREIDYQYAQNERAQREVQDNLHNQYYLDVRTGRMKVDNIPFKDLYAMEPAIVENLYQAQARASAPPSAVKVPSDRGVVDSLYSLKAANDPAALRMYFARNSAKLDDEDFDRWSKITTEEITPPEVEAVLTMQQRIKAYTEETFRVNATADTATRKLTNQFENWFINYQVANGKTPSDMEQLNYFDTITMEYGSGGWFNRDKPIFNMDAEEKAGVVEQLRTQDPAVFQTILDIVGEDPPLETLLQAYRIYDSANR